MPLNIIYNRRTEWLTVTHTYGDKKEVVVMKAYSGGLGRVPRPAKR